MNDRNATGILTEQRPQINATFHGSKERLSLLWIFYMFNAAYSILLRCIIAYS